jgi:phosphocarrier protein HPr
MAVSREVKFQHKSGLHARPAAAFVKAAASFTSRITIENTSKASKAVNAKSIMSVMAAGVKENDDIVITANGADEKAAIDTLVALVKNNFGET